MNARAYNRRQLWLIIKNEYLTDITSKGFWIATFVFPFLMTGFGILIGFLAADSETLQNTANPLAPEKTEMTPEGIMAMLIGMFLTLFLMIYGAQIFNKVKTEKCNRIMEVLATCIEGRTMMLAKIISVALTGLTQLLLWTLLLVILVGSLMLVFAPDISFEFLSSWRFYGAIGLGLLYFIGGYLLFGSLYAASGALTDKNNENQEYMTILTFLLLGSFYLGQFAVDNTGSALTVWCAFIPFTSPTVGAVAAISGGTQIWQTVISLIILYATAFLCVSIAGKIYRSSILLTGKKFAPKDIMVFLRSK